VETGQAHPIPSANRSVSDAVTRVSRGVRAAKPARMDARATRVRIFHAPSDGHDLLVQLSVLGTKFSPGTCDLSSIFLQSLR